MGGHVSHIKYHQYTTLKPINTGNTNNKYKLEFYKTKKNVKKFNRIAIHFDTFLLLLDWRILRIVDVIY